jgi:TPR repeat protein
MGRWGSALGCFWAVAVLLATPVAAASRTGADLQGECDANLRFSCAALGLRYKYGDGVPVDLKRAYALFQHACKEGLQYACGYAAEMLIEGEGVTRDRFAGALLMRRACAAGDANSCLSMRRLGIEATRSGRALRE